MPEAWIRDDGAITVRYANAGAVTAKEIITIPGIGAAVAHDSYGATVSGVYYIEGIDIVVNLTAGSNPQQGDDVYWDASTNLALEDGNALQIATDPYLGEALENASAAGGKVLVRLRKNEAIANSAIKEKHLGQTTSAGRISGAIAAKTIDSARLKALLDTTEQACFPVKAGDTVLCIELLVGTAAGAANVVTFGPDATARTAGKDVDGIVKAANANLAGVYSTQNPALTYQGALMTSGIWTADADGNVVVQSSADGTASAFVGGAVMYYIPA
jgi:hypothetical protein